MLRKRVMDRNRPQHKGIKTQTINMDSLGEGHLPEADLRRDGSSVPAPRLHKSRCSDREHGLVHAVFTRIFFFF